VRGLAWDAAANTATLDATLKAAAQARLTETAKGKVLIGSASNGTQVTYSLPPLGDLSAADVADVVSEILDRVDVIRVATPGATDTQIVTKLLADLQPVRAFRSDFTALSRT
jgi:hypothetical protein